MKTTLEIDEGVMRQLKERAAHEGRTMSELVETALRALLAKEEQKAKELPPLPVWDGGGWVVDAGDRKTMYELFEAEDPLIQEMKSWSKDGRDDSPGRD
ncbi:MAG TPA: ribbon-helix-helix protein, CopG family [Anaeromyxobacter sp.]|nr:ribbon-helix-helix protein, CopG family [Anaeromyxobacter sp.]